MQPRPRTSGLTTVVVIAVVIILISGIVGAVVFTMLANSGPTTVRATSYQFYEGDLNRTLLYIVLAKEGYQPANKTTSNATVDFKPFCGDPGSDEANKTLAIFVTGEFILNADNISVRINTRPYTNTEAHKNLVEDTSNCALDKLANIMKDDLNVSLAFQKIDVAKYGKYPGFELFGAVGVMAQIVKVRSVGKQK